MNRLIYSHKNAAFNGKVIYDGKTYFGYYAYDRRFYLAVSDKDHYNGKSIIASSEYDYASAWTRDEKFIKTISILRGISYDKAQKYVNRISSLQYQAAFC